MDQIKSIQWPFPNQSLLPARGVPAARMTMWSLTLPQVAATLAATLVAFDTRNPAGQRLIDGRLLNVVLVLLLTTSILGPVLTEHFAPRLLKDTMPPDRNKASGTP
jgi:hypothetical protein